jgi:hypothetical protein
VAQALTLHETHQSAYRQFMSTGLGEITALTPAKLTEMLVKNSAQLISQTIMNVQVPFDAKYGHKENMATGISKQQCTAIINLLQRKMKNDRLVIEALFQTLLQLSTRFENAHCINERAATVSVLKFVLLELITISAFQSEDPYIQSCGYLVLSSLVRWSNISSVCFELCFQLLHDLLSVLIQTVPEKIALILRSLIGACSAYLKEKGLFRLGVNTFM